MIRVYCKECKHLDTEHLPLSEYACLHPAVVKVVVTNNWFSGTTARLGGDPKELNKNNDCQYFQEKDES